jgi:DNA end-binding protein Ku
MLTCPVALYTASSKSERISLHTLNRETGHRVKREYVDEVTGKPVEREEQVKGYEVDKDEYVILSQDEIDAAIPESTKTIEIDSFVDCHEFDDVYMGNPYYLAPSGKPAQEAFAVIRDAMRKAQVVGIGRTVLFRRDRVLMLRPEHDGILVRLLRFGYEVRPAAEVFESIPERKITGEMLELAEHIIETKKGSFHVDEFEDRYETALAELIKAKQEGRKIEAPPAPKATNVVSLLDALRESAGQKRETAKPAARKTSTAKSGKSAKPAAKAPRRKAG